MPDVDVSTFDYCADPRVFSSPETDVILVPSMRRDRDLRRIAYQEDDYWYLQGMHDADADVIDPDSLGLRAFPTMEEALFEVLGEPVELPDPDVTFFYNEYNLLVDADAANPIWVTFERDDDPYSGGWKAHISQPAPDRYPAYFGGNTPQECLNRMFGVRVADDEGNYEYTPGS